MILQDPEITSIVLVHSSAHHDKGNRYQAAFHVNPLALLTTTHHRHGAEQKWAFFEHFSAIL
jgi:hypothetical protein